MKNLIRQTLQRALGWGKWISWNSRGLILYMLPIFSIGFSEKIGMSGWGFLFAFLAIVATILHGNCLKAWYVDKRTEEYKIKDVNYAEVATQFRQVLDNEFDTNEVRLDKVVSQLMAIVKREL